MAPNLERHPIRKGEYTAYDADGFAFRVLHARRDGGYTASPSHASRDNDWRRFEGRTLAEIADEIGKSRLHPAGAD